MLSTFCHWNINFSTLPVISHINIAYQLKRHRLLSGDRYVVVVSSSHQSLSLGVSQIRSAQSITFLLSVWSTSKGSQKGGVCHEANDHNSGNGCALSGLFYSCTDQGFGCDQCTVVPV